MPLKNKSNEKTKYQWNNKVVWYSTNKHDLYLIVWPIERDNVD